MTSIGTAIPYDKNGRIDGLSLHRSVHLFGKNESDGGPSESHVTRRTPPIEVTEPVVSFARTAIIVGVSSSTVMEPLMGSAEATGLSLTVVPLIDTVPVEVPP